MVFLCILSCQSKLGTLHSPDLIKYIDAAADLFQHGVASGDPQQDAVILWTRVTSTRARSTLVEWEMAKSKTFTEVVRSGQQLAEASSDYTVKVDADQLDPGTTYYYRFRVNEVESQVGRTKTLPAEPDQLKLAVVSCSNFEAGYFNAYRNISRRDDVDCVIHLGDYIYEYGVGTYGDTALGRLNVPDHEIVTLGDYRTRYSQYRMDPDLKAVHQMHPFVTIWDDHEIANNAYKHGAQNHQPDEGLYDQRKSVAKQVYYEWMPIRDGGDLYRSFDFGSLAKLIMLDERLAGRTAPVDSLQDPNYGASDRSMLGEEQLRWFKNELKDEALWKVIGNQVIFSNLNFGPNHWNEVNLDAWDGWPAEQQDIKRFLADQSKGSTIFVTGDTHASWGIETPGPLNRPSPAVAVEIGVTSVTSSNMGDGNEPARVATRESEFKENNPHLKYVSLSKHGYVLLTLSAQEATADFIYVNTVKERSEEEKVDRSYVIQHGINALKRQ